MKQLAEATNEKGEVIASSPGPRPARRAARWSPAVPLETAAAYLAPTRSANAASKRSIHGPSESRPERSTSMTSSSSRSSRYGDESGIGRTDVPGRPPLTLGEAELRGGLTPLAAGCGALGARPYLVVLSSRRSLASFASSAPGTSVRRTSCAGSRLGPVVEPVRPPVAAPADGVPVRGLKLERDRPR